MVIHNPNHFPVTLYKKAVIAPLEESPIVPPGKWKVFNLGPDYAFRIDCDDIAKLLTGNPAVTFIEAYGIGVTVEGYVVLGVGPQQVPGGKLIPYANLDVTAEYARSSEVLNKDIHFVPWWRYWWWDLPWNLGYPYTRILPFQPDPSRDLECQATLVNALKDDVVKSPNLTPPEIQYTLAALDHGRELDPIAPLNSIEPTEPILAAMVSSCEVNGNMLVINYFLVTNRAPYCPNPVSGVVLYPVPVKYSWRVGHWYDLPVVMSQNVNTDLGDFLQTWHAKDWIRVAGAAHTANIQANMAYFFPVWCGLRYWWPWWNGGDCLDIGVGEGESLDVEVITPVRVFMQAWPPPLN